MSKEEMLQRLNYLHLELTEINRDLGEDETVDEATVDALGQLVTDVGGLIERANDLIETEAHGQQQVRDRIQEFQIDHPRVSQFLTQVTDLLAMMGI